MSGTNNSDGSALRIAKSPDEVISLIAKHALIIELDNAELTKHESILSLTDILINHTEHISADSISPIIKALGMTKRVADTADTCVFLVADDAPQVVFSTLLAETKKAKGEAKERMKSTVTTLYALARDSEKPRFAKLASRYGFKFRHKASPINPKKAPAKPIKIRRAA